MYTGYGTACIFITKNCFRVAHSYVELPLPIGKPYATEIFFFFQTLKITKLLCTRQYISIVIMIHFKL
jgi:hypothetical protein